MTAEAVAEARRAESPLWWQSVSFCLFPCVVREIVVGVPPLDSSDRVPINAVEKLALVILSTRWIDHCLD